MRRTLAAVTLAAALTSTLGAEWVLWEPETLRAELEEAFNRSEVSTLNWDQIQAVRTCLLVPSPWENWSVFARVCPPINNNILDFETLQKPTAAQCAFCVHVMAELGDHKWSDEVEQFIAAAHLDESIVYLPPPVDFAQEWSSEPRVRCQDCGWRGDDVGPVCWGCGSSKLDHYTERDPAPVKKRYDEIVAQIEKTGDHDLLREDSTEDVQTAKLLVVRGYLEHRQSQLEEQVRLLNVSTLPTRNRNRR